MGLIDSNASAIVLTSFNAAYNCNPETVEIAVAETRSRLRFMLALGFISGVAAASVMVLVVVALTLLTL